VTQLPTDPDLAGFLQAEDLDELLARRDSISEITREDAAALTAIVTSGDDEQAMANLLMYPELIPPPLRTATVLAALDGDADGYPALAAASGIGRVEWTADERAAIGERLLRLSRTASAPTSTIAARSVEHVVEALPLTSTVEFLGELRSDERHNVLAALVKQFGSDAVRAEAGYAGSIGTMSPDDVEDIERRLDGHSLPLPVDLAVLVYIPNLHQWDPAR
jgi:hypothetical protein